MKLILKLLLGIVCGLFVGSYAPKYAPSMMVFFEHFQNYFGQFIRFMVPLIILFMITSGIGSLRSGANKMLGSVLVVSYISTVLAGIFAFFIGSSFLPHVISESVGFFTTAVQHHGTDNMVVLKPLFDVTTALALAFIFGLGISASRANSLQQFFSEGSHVVDWVLGKFLIPLLPVYVGAVFAELASIGEALKTLQDFAYVLGLAIALHLIWLVLLYVLAGTIHHSSPWRLLRLMLPAYTTAIGTMSSAATIPVTLRSVKNMGVSESSANFTVPLCANIHLSGSMITIMTCATAVMLLAGDLSVVHIKEAIPFILVLGITMVAAPGAPGGAVMAALGVLKNMMGFTDEHLAMMIALYIAQDSFGTACNVTGDGFIALLMDKMLPKERTRTMGA